MALILTLRVCRALSVGGPLLAASFVAVWFPWPLLPVSLQFVLCLCLYDGFLTWIDLSHSALLVDLAASDHDRAELSKFSSVFRCVAKVRGSISGRVQAAVADWLRPRAVVSPPGPCSSPSWPGTAPT